jgi:hypothetical protein
MSKKPKFKPRITRVKLNPEQAVLACDCFDNNTLMGAGEAEGYWQGGAAQRVCLSEKPAGGLSKVFGAPPLCQGTVIYPAPSSSS